MYFLLTNGKEEQMVFLTELFIQASSSGLRLLVHRVVREVKLDAQEKLFVLTTFSRFIELCHSIQVSLFFFLFLFFSFYDKTLVSSIMVYHKKVSDYMALTAMIT